VQVKDLSLRERLALAANQDVDKLPAASTNPLYDTMGGGSNFTLNSITNMIGQKKQRDDSDDDDGYQAGGPM